jgi:hypothetical protein
MTAVDRQHVRERGLLRQTIVDRRIQVLTLSTRATADVLVGDGDERLERIEALALVDALDLTIVGVDAEVRHER